MGISILDVIRERTRQQSTGDDNYYRRKPYLFKLITEPGKGPTATGVAYFPLPLAPQEFSYTLPFAVEVTRTQNGGAVVEEGGIATGNLRLSATAGMRLKKARDTSASSGNPEFTGQFPKQYAGGQWEMSGQMLTWRMLGRCFDAYSKLKKDPTTAHKTALEFHNLKDRLHLRVHPISVEISKESSGPSRLTPYYRIECHVTGPAAKTPTDTELSFLSDDKDIFDYMSDASRFVRDGLNMLKSTIDDFTSCIADMARRIDGFIGIVDDLKSIADSVGDFLSGVTNFVNIPAKFIQSVTDAVESAYSVANAAEDIPQKARNALARCEDALDALKVGCRNHFRKDLDSMLDEYGRRFNRLNQANLSTSEQAVIALESVRGATGGRTINETFGGSFTPGDLTRQSLNQVKPEATAGEYTGFKQVKVEQGDTIQSIATKYMGNPQHWKTIAVVNNLRAPYISQGVSANRVLTVGSPIVVPSKSTTAPQQTVTSGDSSSGGNQIDDRMGTDLKWFKLSNGKWSWAINEASGSGDLITVSGLDNLKQGLETIMRTERGTDMAFPALGLPRAVGSTDLDAIFEEGRAAVEDQIEGDPRVERLLGLSFEVNVDVLTANIDIQPIGEDTARQVPVTLYD